MPRRIEQLPLNKTLEPERVKNIFKIEHKFSNFKMKKKRVVKELSKNFDKRNIIQKSKPKIHKKI